MDADRALVYASNGNWQKWPGTGAYTHGLYTWESDVKRLLQVSGQPGLCSTFQDSLSYRVRPCLKKNL